jgi:hypothetical protein
MSIAAFAGFAIMGWRRGLDRARQTKIAALGVGAIGITIFGAATAARDWIPCLLIFLFYSQAGQFVTRVDAQVETRLKRLDERWVAPCLDWCNRQPLGSLLFACLELAYLSYYVFIPLAAGALYWFGKQRRAGFFWTVVLAAAYGSCAMLAFIQTRPPRMIGEKWSEGQSCSKVRALNLWILRHGSVQANTFPSAHVSIATACALALIAIRPAWVGLGFLLVAIGIAFGAVAGRYHYLADAVLGIILAAMAALGGAVLAACGVAG